MRGKGLMKKYGISEEVYNRYFNVQVNLQNIFHINKDLEKIENQLDGLHDFIGSTDVLPPVIMTTLNEKVVQLKARKAKLEMEKTRAIGYAVEHQKEWVGK
jgi:SMC interacting uncharacterized protein involved in chromosome segregation